MNDDVPGGGQARLLKDNVPCRSETADFSGSYSAVCTLTGGCKAAQALRMSAHAVSKAWRRNERTPPFATTATLSTRPRNATDPTSLRYEPTGKQLALPATYAHE